MKKAFFLVSYALMIILPAKAQLYAGGGFSFYTDKASNSDNTVNHLSIAPEIGYHFSPASLGLAFEYAKADYDGTLQDINAITFEPYLRPHIIEVGSLCFFIDVKFSYTEYFFGWLYYNKSTYLIGLSPGLSFRLTDRLSSVINFGIAGYCSDATPYGFEGWGVSLSTTTTKLGFYYSFW